MDFQLIKFCFAIMTFKFTFQWNGFTTGSDSIRFTKTLAMCDVSLDIAPSSAALNFDDLWIAKPSSTEYPYRLGLNSLRMFGIVRYSRQVFSPPIENETPWNEENIEWTVHELILNIELHLCSQQLSELSLSPFHRYQLLDCHRVLQWYQCLLVLVDVQMSG